MYADIQINVFATNRCESMELGALIDTHEIPKDTAHF